MYSVERRRFKFCLNVALHLSSHTCASIQQRFGAIHKLSSVISPTSSRTFLVRRFLSSASEEAVRKKNLEELFPSNQSEPTKSGKWQLMVSVCLERYPVIAPPPTDLEIQYQKMLRALEDEQSLLSYHELRREEDRKAAKKAAGKTVVVQSDKRQIITAQDFEDASIEERKRFVVAPRSLGEDGNLQSLNRLLDRKLVFLIPAAFGDKHFWDIPSAFLGDGETLSQAAERALLECLDISPAATFYGNAPRKFYKYKYPKPIIQKTGAIGGKIFMFKAELPRQAKITPRVKDFRWLSRDELETAIKHRKYRQSVSSFIFE